MPDATRITRRINRFYVATGTEDQLRPATVAEFEAAIDDMKQRQHVNVNVVKFELERLQNGGPWPLTKLELDFLQSAPLGVSCQKFFAQHGASRRYEVLPHELFSTQIKA